MSGRSPSPYVESSICAATLGVLIAVLLPARATSIFKLLGGTSQPLHLMLLGIHSANFRPIAVPITIALFNRLQLVDTEPLPGLP